MIRNLKHMTVMVIAVGLSVCGLRSQTLPSLLLNQDPKALSLGMTGVASDAGAYAVQNNIAAVSHSDHTLDAQAGYGIWQPSYADFRIISAAATCHLGKFGFGLDVKKLNMPEYSGISGSGADIRDSEFQPNEFNVAAGASYAVLEGLSAGLTLRYIGSRLAEDASAGIFGTDFSVYFKKNGIRAGLSVNNIGTEVKYSDTSYPQPMMAKVGAGYDLHLGNSSLAFSTETDVMFAGGVMAGLGCEYSFKEMIYARAGYHYGNSVNVIPSFASLGIGLKLFGAQLNVAALFGSAVLSDSMNISAGYTF